ncbi:DUF177 domain-containing protein [bacterium]|nr:DUF177 domain-containing protein [bacterium]
MKIQLTDVRDKSRDFRLDGKLVLEGFNDRVGEGEVCAYVHVNPAGERWYIGAEVEGSFSFHCDRCGKAYDDFLDGEFSLVVLSKAVRGLDEDESEDVILLSADKAELDLSAQIRESMLLALPMQFLCQEDCAGLDSQSGADLNEETSVEATVDPRWGPLMDLKEKMELEEDSGSGERQE